MPVDRDLDPTNPTQLSQLCEKTQCDSDLFELLQVRSTVDCINDGFQNPSSSVKVMIVYMDNVEKDMLEAGAGAA